MTENTRVFHPVTKALHWIVALALFLMFGSAVMMESTPPEWRGAVFLVHKSTGFLILILMLARIVWVNLRARPPLPLDHMPKWQVLAAKFVHDSLYALGFITPFIGWALVSAGPHPFSFFGLFEIPKLPFIIALKDWDQTRVFLGGLHETLATIFAALVVVHIGATFLHHFVDRDDVLLRISPTCTHAFLKRLRGEK